MSKESYRFSVEELGPNKFSGFVIEAPELTAEAESESELRDALTSLTIDYVIAKHDGFALATKPFSDSDDDA